MGLLGLYVLCFCVCVRLLLCSVVLRCNLNRRERTGIHTQSSKQEQSLSLCHSPSVTTPQLTNRDTRKVMTLLCHIKFRFQLVGWNREELLGCRFLSLIDHRVHWVKEETCSMWQTLSCKYFDIQWASSVRMRR